MAIPTSGALSFSTIRIELDGGGTGTTAPTGLDNAENGGYGAINKCSTQYPLGANPAAVSEWYGYNHTATPTTYLTNTEGPSGTSAGACALQNADQTTIYVVGSVYYITSICTTLVEDGYHRDSTSTNWYQFASGALVSSGACTTTTTTTTTAACICSAKTSTCTAACPYQCACTSPDTTPCFSPCA